MNDPARVRNGVPSTSDTIMKPLPDTARSVTEVV